MNNLDEIKKWAEEIQGSWDGNEAGSGEDRAMQANDILEAIDNLQELIKGMEEL